MIRVHVDLSPLRPVLALLECGLLSLATYRMHPLAPYWRRVILRRAELRSPSRPNRRLS